MPELLHRFAINYPQDGRDRHDEDDDDDGDEDGNYDNSEGGEGGCEEHLVMKRSPCCGGEMIV